jgi:hypothetical protein
MSSSTAALSYHEPDIVTILVLSSFLLLLNATNYSLDRILYCGLVGQILIGAAWGVPGGNWLQREVQDTIRQLGYLGLILIVYEGLYLSMCARAITMADTDSLGGLNTQLKTLKANLFLSVTVATIGIGAAIALSFILRELGSKTFRRALSRSHQKWQHQASQVLYHEGDIPHMAHCHLSSLSHGLKLRWNIQLVCCLPRRSCCHLVRRHCRASSEGWKTAVSSACNKASSQSRPAGANNWQPGFSRSRW